jgi:hypothetical protein
MASALGMSEAEAQAAAARRRSRFDAGAEAAVGGQGSAEPREPRRWLWHDSQPAAASSSAASSSSKTGAPTAGKAVAAAAVAAANAAVLLASGKAAGGSQSSPRVVGTSSALEKAYERMPAGMLPNPVSQSFTREMRQPRSCPGDGGGGAPVAPSPG